MRIIFAGTPSAAVPTLRAVVAAGHDVCAVLTRPPAPVGRGRTLTPSDVAVVAADLNLPVVTPRSLRDAGFEDWLRDQQADVAVVVAYGAMIPASLLDIPRLGWFNLHFSLLPAWRGAAPVQAAIAAGDEITGATIFRIDTGLDTGPVAAVMTEQIQPQDTAGTLLERLAESGASFFCSVLDAMDGGHVHLVPQSSEGVSRAPLITTADARIDWRLPAVVIERRVRAFTPSPGAWSSLAGQRLRVDHVSLAASDGSLAPGEVAHLGGHVLVGTGSTALHLEMVTPAGKRSMSASSWWNGLRSADIRTFDLDSGS